MPTYSKVFTYETDGLSYTIGVYEDPETGAILADISVIEGAMDVNAVYVGDSDFSGDSESLNGPLNMNGAEHDGEKVQWDSVSFESDPGLGPKGEDKETYLNAGDTLTVELAIDSLDDVDVIGIRATSTTTEEGSIKAVSGDPEEPEEPMDPVFDKVGFGVEVRDDGVISNGVYVFEEDLPEGEEGTFENYVNYLDSLSQDDPQYAVSELETVIFYEVNVVTDDNGDPLDAPRELFRIDAPADGFEGPDDLIAAYNAAIADGALHGALTEGESLIAALSIEETPDESVPVEEEPEPEADMEMV